MLKDVYAKSLAGEITKKDALALPISDRTVSSLVQYFKLLADDSRLRILLTLAREGETHVSALCQMLGQSQPAVSHHLTQLRNAGLVGFRRDGKFNFFRLDSTALSELIDQFVPEGGNGQQKIDLGEHVVAIKRK